MERQSVAFKPTEVGSSDGLAGASGLDEGGESHYVLFGPQEDEQHPSDSGVYFEFDGQLNGGVDLVLSATVKPGTPGSVVFLLRDGRRVEVHEDVAECWSPFVTAVRKTFLIE